MSRKQNVPCLFFATAIAVFVAGWQGTVAAEESPGSPTAELTEEYRGLTTEGAVCTLTITKDESGKTVEVRLFGGSVYNEVVVSGESADFSVVRSIVHPGYVRIAFQRETWPMGHYTAYGEAHIVVTPDYTRAIGVESSGAAILWDGERVECYDLSPVL